MSGGNASQVKRGHRFPLGLLLARAHIWAAVADSCLLALSCLISYWLATTLLAYAHSGTADDLLGGMWAAVATVFVLRHSYAKSMAAALSRMSATLVSFTLCLAYLVFLPFHPWALAVLIGLSALAATLISRPEDAITAAITTTVVMVVAALAPHDAWQQPILRLADTAIGVTVGIAAAWTGLRFIHWSSRTQQPPWQELRRGFAARRTVRGNQPPARMPEGTPPQKELSPVPRCTDGPDPCPR